MQFKIVKIISSKKKEDFLKFLSVTDEINSVFDDRNELLYFSYGTDLKMKVVPLFFNEIVGKVSNFC